MMPEMDTREIADTSPCIAIIMSVYNERPDWLIKSVESILKQTWNNIRFYIALDNPDNLELKQLLESYSSSDKRVKLIINQTNLGLVGSLNKLLEEVEEPFVARMDADDISLPTRLETEMAFLQEYSLDFVSSGSDLLSEGGEVTKGRLLPNLPPSTFAEIQKYTNVSVHPSWLVRTKIYRDLEGYRNIDHCEDLDFILRALQHGYKIGRIKDPLIHYRFRSTGISYSNSLIQDEKAEALRYLYSNNIDLESDRANQLIKDAGAFDSEKESERAIRSKTNIDACAKALYEGDAISFMRIAIPSFILQKRFRKDFIKALKNRMRLQKILKTA